MKDSSRHTAVTTSKQTQNENQAVSGREIAFIDPTVSDLQTLLAGMRPGVEAILLSGNAPALAEMADAVAARGSFDAIHVVAHGASGEVRFGAGALALETIDDHATPLNTLGAALARQGRLLLWSCETGQGECGSAFVSAMARATGAAVGAASGLIGAAAQGGSWTLDGIAAAAPLSVQAQERYAAVLAATKAPVISTVTDNIGGVTGTLSSGQSTDDTDLAIKLTFASGGTAPVAGDTIKLFNGASQLGTTYTLTPTDISAGFATVQTGALSNGTTYTITATINNSSGASAASGSFVVTEDTSAPAAPSTPDMAAASDTGSSATDNVTKTATPTFTGTAEANSTVKLFEGITLLGSATADASGNWSITSSTLAGGAHSITAKATDAAGNTGVASGALAITIDSTAPNAPAGLDLVSASDSGPSSTDNLTNVTTPTITGTAEANSTITLFDGLVQVGSATATAGGTWSITTSALAAGLHSLTAQATDAAGNTGVASSALSINIDNGAPPAPSAPDLTTATDTGSSHSDNLTNNTTPVFSGTAEANSTVTLFDGSSLVGSASADGSGNWTITSSTLSAGAHSLTAKATDAAGNVSIASGALAISIDTGAPATPGAPDLTAASDSGTSSTDNLTNITTPTFSGNAEANSTVTLFDGATQVGSATADNAGAYSVTSSTLATGAHNMTIKATDAAGNTSAASAALAITIDTTAPTVPSGLDLVVASDSGASGTDNITNVTTPQFSGSADSGTVINLFDGSTLVGTTTANGGGHWNITSSALTAGSHVITAKSTDAAGNTSVSTPLTVTIDTTTATPSTPLLAAASDSGISNSDGISNVTTPTLSGTAEANSTVVLLDGATQVGTATADASGNWSITSAALAQGNHNLTAKATDIAGNVSAASGALALTIDTAAPSAPSALVLSAASDSGSSSSDHITNVTTPTVSGTAEANSSVTLYDGATAVGNANANASGAWVINSAALASGNHLLTAKAVDAAGNVSASSNNLAVSIDVSAPAITSAGSAAAINENSGANQVVYTATATDSNAIVYSLAGGSDSNLSINSTSGAVSLAANPDFEGQSAYSFTVVATDSAGNQSQEAVTLAVNNVDEAPVVTNAGAAGDEDTTIQ
ncbi:MAG: Ig-like domain-containing protein, partial [Pseudomonadota bacterium]